MLIEPRCNLGWVGGCVHLLNYPAKARATSWPTSNATLVNAERFYPLESIYHDAWKPGVFELDAQILALIAILVSILRNHLSSSELLKSFLSRQVIH